MMKPPPRILERKIKMLASELKMLQSYKLDADLLYDDYKSEFSSDIAYIETRLTKEPQPQENAPPATDPANTLKIDPASAEQRWRKTEDGWEREDTRPEDDPQSDSSAKPPPPSWAKKLYKKIALVSHPDRTIEEDNKRKLNKIFTDSASAMSTGDFHKLVGFALDLGIDLQDTDIDHVPVLTSRIHTLKAELKVIEESIEWLWGESLGVTEMRVNIASLVLQKKGIPLNKEELANIIQEMDDKISDPGPDC